MGWGPLSWRAISLLVDMTLPTSYIGGELNYTLQVYPSGGSMLCAAVWPFITLPTDTLSNQLFEGRLKTGPIFRRSIVDGVNFGKMSTSYGELELHNEDGFYDATVQTTTIDGRKLVLNYGPINTATGIPASFDTYSRWGEFVAQDWHLDSDTLRLVIRSNSFKLDGPVSTNVYGGSGAADGSSDMAGKRKPRAFGSVSNASAPLIDPAYLVYQINDGVVSAISAVYDMGYALPGPDADYPNYATLTAAVITAGHYVTCKALGLFRLGSAPYGLVTCDVLGDASSGYVSDTASIARRLIALGAPQVDLVDEGSFATLTATQPAVIGYYLGLDDQKTVRQAIDELMDGIGGWGEFRRDGAFEVGRFTAPAASVVDSYTGVDVLDETMRRLELPSGVNPPAKRQRVAYARNFTIQTEVSGGVSATRTEMLKNPYAVATHSNTTLAATIAAAHALAQDPDVVQGYFVNSADAVAEADRLLSLHGSVVRSMYSFQIKAKGLTRKIGDTIQVTYPRFDLALGKNLVIVGMDDETEPGVITFTAWG